MDGVSFQVWLEAIGLLTAVKRQAGFACLALAAADDDRDPIPYDTAWTAPLLAEPPSGASAGRAPLRRRGWPAGGDRGPGGNRFCRPPPRRRLPAGSSTADVRIVPPETCNAGVGSAICRACRRTFNGLTGTPMARLRKKDRWAALSRRTTGCVAMAARPSSGSPARGAFRAKSCLLPAAQGPRHTTFTSTISTDTTAVSRNGYAPSMASPPSISTPIWDGDGSPRHAAAAFSRPTGFAARSGWMVSISNVNRAI